MMVRATTMQDIFWLRHLVDEMTGVCNYTRTAVLLVRDGGRILLLFCLAVCCWVGLPNRQGKATDGQGYWGARLLGGTTGVGVVIPIALKYSNSIRVNKETRVSSGKLNRKE